MNTEFNFLAFYVMPAIAILVAVIASAKMLFVLGIRREVLTNQSSDTRMLIRQFRVSSIFADSVRTHRSRD
jgi:hypothetical protein